MSNDLILSILLLSIFTSIAVNGILRGIAKKNKVEILCLPELSITGYGCQDLFYHQWFIKKSYEILDEIIEYTESITLIIGNPVIYKEKL